MMSKRLLHTILAFALGLILICGLMAAMILYRANSSSVFTAHPNQHILLLGDSHPACGIVEDSAIVHLARSGEAWFYQVIKGRHVLENNGQIKTVLIELNLGQLSPIMENWIWDKEHVERAMKSYYAILPGNYLWQLFKRDPLVFIQSNLIAQRRLLGEDETLANQSYFKAKEWGGFETNDRSCKDSLLIQKVSTEPRTIQPQPENVLALKEFVQWCQSKKVDVIFIRCPQHASAESRYEQSTDDWRKENFAEVPFLDFKKMNLPDSLFLDREHLNVTGARWFTPILLERLNQIQSINQTAR
jgi:hypothetical protein